MNGAKKVKPREKLWRWQLLLSFYNLNPITKRQEKAYMAFSWLVKTESKYHHPDSINLKKGGRAQF